MFALFLKQNRKKGFTLSELIIVLAIIAVMTVIAVPTFMSLQEKQDKSGAYAKTFYYLAQDIFNDINISGTIPFETNSGTDSVRLETDTDPTPGAAANSARYVLCVHVTKAGVPDLVRLWDLVNVKTLDQIGTISDLSMFYADTDHFDETSGHLVRAIQSDCENTVQNMSEDGFFYAYADYRFRVYEAYWTRSSLEELAVDNAGNMTNYTYDNGYFNDQIVGIFPEDVLEFTGGRLFDK